MTETDTMFVSIMVIGVCIFALGGYMIVQSHYGSSIDVGSVVVTTAEYGFLTNGSFEGVVIRGETRDDPALTVRNRDGDERRIATEFLELMR